MAKPIEKPVQRSRTADEMQAALIAVAKGDSEQTIAPHYDNAATILADVTKEVLELRQLRADVLAFFQDQQPKLTRR